MIKDTGFEMPESVRNATYKYRKNSDRIEHFIDDEMDKGSTCETQTGEAYNRYKQWCGVNGFYPENAANFKASLSNLATLYYISNDFI